MTEETKQELRRLLNEAMETVAIESSEGYESISVETYREYLQSVRKYYRPDLDSLTRLYYPNIQNETIESKLLDFIKVEFKDYINEEVEVIQPASYGIGNTGSVSGQDVEFLLIKLLQIAIASGEQRAIVSFDKSTRETTGAFQRIILLQGPDIDRRNPDELIEIQIYEGIRLVFLPYNHKKLPPYLFDGGFSSLFFQSTPGIFMRKAIIVIDCEVTPLFSKPKFAPPTVHSDGSKSYSANKDAYSFERKIKSSEYPEFDVNQFCRAISLTCNFACVPILDWGYIDPDELFSVIGHGLVPTAGCVLPNEPVSLNRISETQIPEIKRHYEILTSLDSETRKKLQIPLDRWINSKTEDNPVDKIIDLGIAFESLYLSDRDGNSELSFQFRLRASWHLGENKADRERLIDEFKTIYSLRSTAVHNGAVPEKIKIRKGEERIATSEFIPRAQDLCRDSIIKILEDGEFRDWNSLILG